MAALKAAFLAVLLCQAGSAVAERPDRWADHVAEASARFGVPEAWIRRVIRAESGGRTMLHGRPIVSHAGAMGLMQLMPGTWREMRRAHGLGSDPHQPRDNILAGTAYLRAMFDRFGYPGLFAAYNAGPARYSEHLVAGRRLPAETVAYVAQVTGDKLVPAPRAPGSAIAQDLFAVLHEEQPRPMSSPSGGSSAGRLFVQLRSASVP